MKYSFLFPLLVFVWAYSACRPDDDYELISPNEYLLGGATTITDNHSNAFQVPAANLDALGIAAHLDGDVAFEGTFVTAPATNNSGLGPLYNQTSCAACHNKNGKSAAPQSGFVSGGLLLRLSMPGTDSQGMDLPVPGFGGQLQTLAVFGKQAEATVSIAYQQMVEAFLDGESYTLTQPIYTLNNPYTPLPDGYLFSPRIAPTVIGLGLLEAIPEATIRATADPNDANNDGISGKANEVWDAQNQQWALGRFGWKAGQPSLIQQAAAAYRNDMGITNPIFTSDNCTGQPQCDNLADDPEIDWQTLRDATFYTQSLAVPAARQLDDAQVLRGKQIFVQAKCNACHTEQFTTGNSAEFPFLANQSIRPYTDLLLHDMGAALADNRPEAQASGSEWRTPPLWGIGLTELVSSHHNYLHDGRANSLLEAIMWHGGEATAAKQHVRQLSKTDRDALIAFLNAL